MQTADRLTILTFSSRGGKKKSRLGVFGLLTWEGIHSVKKPRCTAAESLYYVMQEGTLTFVKAIPEAKCLQLVLDNFRKNPAASNTFYYKLMKPYPVAVLHSAGFSAMWVPNYRAYERKDNKPMQLLPANTSIQDL